MNHADEKNESKASPEAALAARLDAIEARLADSSSRLDQVQHLVELVLAETLSRRLDGAPGSDPAIQWSAAGFPVLPRNVPVYFGSGTKTCEPDPDVYLASGWHVREPWGVWGSNSIHALRFALDRWHGGYVTVSLSLFCFLADGMDRPQVDISANGYFLGSHQLDAVHRVVRLRLPPSCIGNGDILFQFQHEAPVSPASHGIVVDPRMLGVGLVMLSAG
ncbi:MULTISPECIES: hypothetical protein [Sphingobium]|uniref:hypothetical protein n=1 Tax=Sphingobium TaxID=165695 RepID=UPI000C3A8A61|nr:MULTISPECIES: hypothetical protein [Sphingobium]MAX16140.1 hypothetical protein [Sphingobium sp.]MCC4256876.1 hypothetical protein [Sphingobium lactosutens]MEC9018349.1 hypothetical protein [Pseudomonadota bacterium]